MSRSNILKSNKKTFVYTGRFSWTKDQARKRVKNAKKINPKNSFRILKVKTHGNYKRKHGYAIFGTIGKRKIKKR
jgi:hypothetical protein